MTVDYQSPNGKWYAYSFLQGNNAEHLDFREQHSTPVLNLTTTWSVYGSVEPISFGAADRHYPTILLQLAFTNSAPAIWDTPRSQKRLCLRRATREACVTTAWSASFNTAQHHRVSFGSAGVIRLDLAKRLRDSADNVTIGSDCPLQLHLHRRRAARLLHTVLLQTLQTLRRWGTMRGLVIQVIRTAKPVVMPGDRL